ncbi:protein of unknown function [Methylorubrum extorquens]|uniref:Uncharacterized protein n=1 Tax=Methylorubrum extorquens TaxID=408 RepID=A0A2N9AIS6_METEX|nr:protein of unknown function [Methylorubrum extorquens]
MRPSRDDRGGFFCFSARFGRCRSIASRSRSGAKPERPTEKRARRICGSSGRCAVLHELELPESTEHWTTTVMRTISATGGLVDRKILDVAKVFLERLEGRYPVRGGVLFGSRARAPAIRRTAMRIWPSCSRALLAIDVPRRERWPESHSTF